VIGSLEFGILGLRLTPEDHACATCSSLMKRDAILIPYLREGLLAGDKGVWIVDATDPSAALVAAGVEPDAQPARAGQRKSLGARRTPIGERASSRFWRCSTHETSTSARPSERSLRLRPRGRRSALGVTRHSCCRGGGGMRVRAQRVPAPVFEGDPVPLRSRTITAHPKLPPGGIVLDNAEDLEPDVFLVTSK
jgi:hypothetical protein